MPPNDRNKRDIRQAILDEPEEVQPDLEEAGGAAYPGNGLDLEPPGDFDKRAGLLAFAGVETGVSLDDFHAYMPMHGYIYVPTREMWPAASVNARIPPIVIGADKDRKTISASAWLDRNKPVEQMTWAPGLPTIIQNRLILQGGWIERVGVNCFNLYRAPTIRLGDAAQAAPWIEHVHKVYPDHANHISSLGSLTAFSGPKKRSITRSSLAVCRGSAKIPWLNRQSARWGRVISPKYHPNICSAASTVLQNP
jgi:hypothetical protein